jgi:hypothetical protein
VRDRVGLEQLAFNRYRCLEFVHQPRLAAAGFGNDRSDLAAPAPGQFKRPPELCEFLVAPDELRQAPPRRELEMGAQRSRPDHFVNIGRFGHALECSWTQGAQLEIALNQVAGLFA